MKNSEFITGKVPITKEEVRAICLSKLNVSECSSFLDIGSGTGSVTVEAAVINRGMSVFSIECDERAYNLTKENIEKFELDNVIQIKDMAPTNHVELKDIDAVFVGGTRNNLVEIIQWTYGIMKDRAKIVFTFILLENFYKCMEVLEESDFRNIEVSQVSVSKLEKLGKGKYFKPENPIFIISAEK